MPRFLITETCEYIVEADDEEHAEAIFLDAEDINEFCIGIPDRIIEEAD